MSEAAANGFSAASCVRPGEVHRRVYADPAIFELELRQLFRRTWTLLGHACQAPQPGDYFLGRMGLRSVIVTRNRAGNIRVMENQCTHRGATVCPERSGHTPRFVCPYHSWTFDLDGKLLNVPLRDDYEGTGFELADHGLRHVPHVELYRGFIFASYDPVTSLADFLGEAQLAFDDIVDRAPDGELEFVPTDLRYRVRANWKLVLENLNDNIHPTFAHASALSALKRLKNHDTLNPVIKLGATAPPLQMIQKLQSRSSHWGHSYTTGLVALANKQVARDAYFEAMAARRGEPEAERILNTDIHTTLLYPSATITSRMQTIRLVRPLSVNETEVVAYVYRLKGAPESVLRTALDYVWISSSPSSFVIVDDLEIYERCQNSYERGDEEWISAHRSLGRDAATNNGEQGNGTSEGYIRNQHAVWARYLGDVR